MVRRPAWTAWSSVFGTDCKDFKFVNSAVAGGAGSNAKQVLANDLQAGKPPSTFQAHAGAELKDYINAGQVDDVSQLYKDYGLDKAFPQNLIDNLTVDGKIYSIPANIHRANVVWANPTVLKKASIDGATAPANVDAWIADLDKLKAAGVKAPLAISKDFAQEMLVEAVLLADLGRGQVHRAVERQDRLVRCRRDGRAEQVQEAADLHQRRPRGDRLAGRAGAT